MQIQPLKNNLNFKSLYLPKNISNKNSKRIIYGIRNYLCYSTDAIDFLDNCKVDVFVYPDPDEPDGYIKVALADRKGAIYELSDDNEAKYINIDGTPVYTEYGTYSLAFGNALRDVFNAIDKFLEGKITNKSKDCKTAKEIKLMVSNNAFDKDQY